MNISRPVSEIIKSSDADEPKKKSREDWKKAKELEEARKAGTAPAEVDEEGKDINPHIPQYISTAPWYFGSSGPTLKHQKVLEDKDRSQSNLRDYYVRGLKGKAATKFRKGACENCGAMTHKKKDCLERPRKVGAKYTGEDIAPDEVLLPNLNHDYDGKRDRWNGFDPIMYHSVIDEHLKVEEAKRILKEEKLKQDLINTGDGVSDASDEDEDEKYADHIDMPGTKVDSKQRITVRNLRIREDTAKYLRNLDLDSAYYDPKTRSMRDNPYKHTGKSPEELQYAGDNFVRYMGDTQKVSQAQLFAWEIAEKGIDIHLQAEPTKAEIIHRELDLKKNDLKESIKESILNKYGGKEYLEAPPKELIFAQTEDYVEYSRGGQIVKGQSKAKIRSIYKEDIHPNRHTTVFGSYWSNGKWGYKCCHSFIKNSYCTGTLGKTTRIPDPDHNNPDQSVNEQEETVNEPKSLLEMHIDKKKKDKITGPDKTKDTDSPKLDQEKLKKALEKEEKMKKEAEKTLQMDDRKRAYHSKYEEEALTAEEIEAYQIKRQRAEDPMSAFISKKSKS